MHHEHLILRRHLQRRVLRLIAANRRVHVALRIPSEVAGRKV
jgi:hypothetical protein